MRRRVRGIAAAAVAGGLIALAIATAQARPSRPTGAVAGPDRCRVADAGPQQPSSAGAVTCVPH